MKIYKQIMKIALPVAFEQIIYTSINFIDTFMVGKNVPLLGLGALAITSLGIANNLFFIFIVSLFGLFSGAAIFGSQYFGSKQYDKLKQLGNLLLLISFVVGLIYIIVITFFGDYIVTLYTKDVVIQKTTLKYLKIAVFTYPLAGMSNALGTQFRVTKKPTFSLYSVIIALFLNIILNYTFIYGHFGFNAMGVAGAALATIIARIISLLFLIFVSFYFKLHIFGNFKNLLTINFNYIKNFFKIAIPTFLHEIFWVTATSVKTALLVNINGYGYSAIQIAVTLSSLVFSFGAGISSACSVLIGNELGSNNYEKADLISKKSIKLISFISICQFLIYNMSAFVIIKLLNQPQDLAELTRQIMFYGSIFIIFSNYSMLFIVGILRAGADVLVPALLDVLSIWLVSIPLIFIGWKVFNVNIKQAYILSRLDEASIIIPCIYRYKTKKWIKKVI